MKNKLFRSLIFLFTLLVGIVYSTAYIHIYALPKFEVKSSETGNVITVYNEEAGELFEKLGVVRQQIHEHNCEHIVIVGKMDRYDFRTLALMASGCKSIDLSKVEADVIPRAAFCVRSEMMQIHRLEKLALPFNLKIIENAAFAGRSSMKIDNLPSSLEFIGENAFMYCENLDFIVPEGIKVGALAFHGCDNVRFSSDSLTQADIQAQNRSETICLLL